MTLTDTRDKLSTCDERLQHLVREMAKEIDILVVCGHRSKEEQDDAYARGNSRVKWPKSAHNSSPSRAVDLAPYKDGKLDWNDIKAFQDMQKKAKEVAERLGIKLRALIQFKSGTIDWPHVELL